MNVLLINPKSSLIKNSWGYKKFFTPIAPLGLCYLAAALNKNHISTMVIDQFASRLTDEDMVDIIRKDKPVLIGLSALTSVMPDIIRLVGIIRRSGIQSKIVLGNIHATCFPEDILRKDYADIVVRGEGELTIVELYEHIKNGKSLEGLPGVSFKSNDKIVHNPDRDLISDLDSIPLPAWKQLNLDMYTEVPLAAISNARALPIMASRGCFYKCYYCSQDTVYPRVRYRNVNKVIQEMEYFSDTLGIEYFGFCDAYFPFDEDSGLEFCNSLIKRSLHKRLKWCTETRVDKVTPKLLRAMKEAGAHLIMYGVEVGNEEILKNVKKHTTLDQARVAFRETRKAGILSQGLFILGLPGENKQTCEQTINFAKELDCDIAKFNIAVPYPGSEFFKDFSKSNSIEKPEKYTSWYDWMSQDGNLIYCPDNLDSISLRRLQRKAMFQFYVRPRMIFRHITKGTISLKNIIYGFIWLIIMVIQGKDKNDAGVLNGK